MKVNPGGKTPRRITAAEAAALVKSGDWLDYGAITAQPDVFDAALAARSAELSRVGIRNCLSVRPRAVLEADPTGEHFQWFSLHFSGYDRKKHDAGISHYIPVNLGEIPDYYRRFIDPIDIVILKTRPADKDGFFNFGNANLWHRAVIERARVVIVETNPNIPLGHGEQNGVHAGEVDFIIEGDGAPVAELPSTAPTEVDRAVGRLIASEIEDGACLQIGIGGMPNAVCSQLLDSGQKDLGIHTEMLTDGLAELYRAGRVTNARKQLHPGKSAYSFALGSRALYDTIDGNPDFHCLPVEATNLPDVIMRNDRVVAINNTTQIDLQGQAASESDGHRHISGTGGQLQFVRGAYASKGGKSFVCLSSTYERKGIRKSRIVLELTPGNVVTTPRSDMMYVVTEYGIANLKGRSVAERAKALIGLAHPDFREGLEREARAKGLIPRFY
ncbi:butyryl-CoA:acetate CoA-transferase [Roseomonas sp. PWR1]|uniref:Butyryl-CoA:acetate CoA-transferase n=1 Tax=Roseomonas nitratireducens TaxID=2820810 RepID=A0ABS4ARW8_9PROT|nr:acetyl-CoA hydrolase/transferase C-terminal domain-containing protein [Neoroseomonas nitratireducens]MBP0464088.1 butyryl-CoA:acetate CoA-transferase [Neoroseomonas nitratireducens]